MKICYKSFDGKEFNTEKECLEHEKNIEIKMYGLDGLTQDPNLAFVVKIDGTGATERFIEMCKKADVGYTGIHTGLNGTYVWSAYNGKFFLLDSLECQALKEYFKDMEAQE